MNPEAFDEMLRVQDRHWWYRSRRDLIGDCLAGLRLPRSAKILEVGAGVGGNARLLAGFGRLTALEASEHAIQRARDAGTGLDIRQGTLPDDIPVEGPFDLVCMLDVLEHLDREHDSLVALRGLLAPDGRLLITVPAYRWMWSSHDELLMHRRRYTRTTLREALARAGFAVERSTHLFAAVLPIAVAARIWDRVRRSSAGTGASVPPAPVNGLLYRLMQVERRLARRLTLPFGLSILCVARVAERAPDS